MTTDWTGRIGFWSAVATLVFSVAYAVPQLILGIDMPTTSKWLFLILLPSLLLAPAFLIQMVAVHHRAPAALRIWTQVGIVFATAYFVFVSIVYFINLTVVVPQLASGELGALEVLRYVPKSFMTGIDALGYASMSLATLFAAPAFGGRRLQRWIRGMFILNGVLAPIILGTQVHPNLAYAAAPWLVAVPLSSLLLTVLFSRSEPTQVDALNG